MPDMSALGAAMTSFKAMKDITEAMIGMRDTALFQSKAIELQSKIMDAQNSVFAANEERAALVERVSQLEAKVTSLEAWEAEKQRYELKHLPPGAYAYSLKEEARGTEPAHYICQPCYESRKKSILQSKGPHNGVEKFSCPACGAEIQQGTFRAPAQQAVTSRLKPWT